MTRLLFVGQICDSDGNFLPPGTPPAIDECSNDWYPFHERSQFELAEFLYSQNQMSAGDIDKLMRLSKDPPFTDHRNLYRIIDNIEHGDVKWKTVSISYTGPAPPGLRPSWMDKSYDIWYRDPLDVVKGLISNPDFAKEFDYAPYHEYIGSEHVFQNLMSGDWAWRQAVSTEGFFNVITMHLTMVNVRTRSAKIPRLMERCLSRL